MNDKEPQKQPPVDRKSCRCPEEAKSDHKVSSLERYCECHPYALECKIFDL
jgi:hypothetical protein